MIRTDIIELLIITIMNHFRARARSHFAGTRLRAAAWILCVAGGCAAPAPAPPAKPVEHEDRICFRVAGAGDLRMLISTRKAGADGFPAASIQLWNDSADDVLVQYQPGSVVLHCGPFEQRGPAQVFGRRREILEPQQEIDFDMPSGRWARSPTTGPVDLMLPSDLPPGKYPMWATFRVGSAAGGTVESERDSFDVP